MPEILTESFCERCGTRYTFESTAPVKTKKLGRFKTLSKGLKNYVLSDENSLDEALAAARSDEERALASSQLEAFQSTFNFCMTCRQYTCASCWNAAEGTCLTCTPLNGHSISPAAFHAVAPLVPAEPLPFEASAWPTTDSRLAPATPDTATPKRDRASAPDVVDGLARLRATPTPAQAETAPAEQLPAQPETAAPVAPEAEPVPSMSAAGAVDDAEADVVDVVDRLARLTEPPIDAVASDEPNVEPPAIRRLDEAYAAVAFDGLPDAESTWPMDAEQAVTPDGADWESAEAEATAEADPIAGDPASLLALSEATTLPADIDERAAAAARRTSDLFARLRPRTGIGVELEAFDATRDAEPTVDEPSPAEAVGLETTMAADEPVAEITPEAEIPEAPEAVSFAEPEPIETTEVAAFAEPIDRPEEPEPWAVAESEVVEAHEAFAFLEPEVVEPAEAVAFAEPVSQPDAAEFAPYSEPEIVEAAEAFAFLEPVSVEAAEAEVEVVEVAEPELVEAFAVAEPEPEPETAEAFAEIGEPVADESWPEESIGSLPPQLLSVIGPAMDTAPEPAVEVAAEAPQIAAEFEVVEAVEVAPEAEVALEAEVSPEFVADPADVAPPILEPETEVVRADIVEQPTWHIVAPDATAAPTNGHVPHPEPAAPPIAASAVTPAAEPQWPTQKQSDQAEQDTALLLSRRTADSPEGLWAASARGVVEVPKGAPIAAVQTCTSCGLSLSATARFCRRCGSSQD